MRNLDDLVMLKLTTVADKIKQEHGGKGVEILGLDMFQKLCDPLLANSANYHSVSKKSYLVNSKPGGLKAGGGATSKNLDSSFISGEIGSPRVNRRGSTLIYKDNLNQPSALGFLGEPFNPMILNQETTESTQRMAEARRQSGNTSMLPEDDPVRFLQEYFRNGEKSQASRKVNANYMMEKLDRKYGGHSPSKKAT